MQKDFDELTALALIHTLSKQSSVRLMPTVGMHNMILYMGAYFTRKHTVNPGARHYTLFNTINLLKIQHVYLLI